MEEVKKLNGQTSDQLSVVSGELIKSYDYKDVVDEVNECLDKIRSNFFELGKILASAKETKIFKLGGFKDIYTFAKTEFNIESTSTKNFINIYKSFKNDEDKLDDKFEDFSSSQLVEILPISDDKEFASKLKSLTVKQLRVVKKKLVTPNDLIRDKELILLNIFCKDVINPYLEKLGLEFKTKLINVSKLDGYFNYLNKYIYSLDKFDFDVHILYQSWDDSIRLFCDVCDDNKYQFRLLRCASNEFNKEFSKWFDEIYKEIVPSEKLESIKEDDSVEYVESEVVEDLPEPELKPCTLRNDKVRSEFIADIDNWEFIGTVADKTSTGLRLAVYRFKAYPQYLKIAVGHPEVADEFDQAKLFDNGPDGKWLAPLTSDRYIVDKLKRDRY
ncbi:MAG: hypothetical protein WCS51_04055 [Bacilli bacterium]